MDALYKILFEVRLLHEYYLTNANGTAIFESNAAGRSAFLAEKFRQNERSITSDVYCQVPERAISLFKNHHLRVLNTYSGFKVVAKVKRVPLPGNITGFLPVVPLPSNFYLPLVIMRKGPEIETITAGRINRNLLAAWYFSNQDVPGTKLYPWLTNPVPAYDALYPYEQGELAVNVPALPATDVASFYIDGLNAEQWLKAPDGRYANENDRLLVKPDFSWRFDKADAVTNASFILKNFSGDTIHTIQVATAGKPFERVPLSFDVRLLNTIPDAPLDNDLIYTLSVDGNNGYSRTKKILFLRDLATNLHDTWGMVCIANKPANSAFQLTDGINRLVTRLNSDGTVNTPHPVFEIWVKSSFPYWRYKSNEMLWKITSNKHVNHCNLQAGVLTTLLPRNISYTPTTFKNPDNTPHYIPNPARYLPLKTEGRKLFADVLVHHSLDMFPMGP